MTKTECEQTATNEVYPPTHGRFGCIIKKPKRWTVDELSDGWCVYDEIALVAVATYLPNREAAERIAAIYEEVLP